MKPASSRSSRDRTPIHDWIQDTDPNFVRIAGTIIVLGSAENEIVRSKTDGPAEVFIENSSQTIRHVPDILFACLCRRLNFAAPERLAKGDGSTFPVDVSPFKR
jgi:hypothetical protein